MKFRTWGGKREGAGRKPNGKKALVPHAVRRVEKGKPLHITLRVVDGMPHLRKRHLAKAIEWALVITTARHDFRICQTSIQGNHIHLLVEADDARALARGMQGFMISCAKQLNARIVVDGSPRRGRVFADLWDLERFSNCPHCFAARAERLKTMNLHQTIPPLPPCRYCF